MLIPSSASTWAFLAVVVLVVVAYSTFFFRAYPLQRSRAVLAVLALCAWMGVTAILANSGVLLSLRGSPKLMVYLVTCNGLALALALSPAGKRLIQQVPIAALVAFHGFRLPLELVLHAWFDQGVLPVQMTYEGHNFDIITGSSALLVGAMLHWVPISNATRWRWVLAFNILGTALLVAVVRIAILSTPWPLRSYMNDPPIQLVFYAPYTWILVVCVAGALWGHVLVFRWLWSHRRQANDT